MIDFRLTKKAVEDLRSIGRWPVYAEKLGPGSAYGLALGVFLFRWAFAGLVPLVYSGGPWSPPTLE
jgi:hypothetical protein